MTLNALTLQPQGFWSVTVLKKYRDRLKLNKRSSLTATRDSDSHTSKMGKRDYTLPQISSLGFAVDFFIPLPETETIDHDIRNTVRQFSVRCQACNR